MEQARAEYKRAINHLKSTGIQGTLLEIEKAADSMFPEVIEACKEMWCEVGRRHDTREAMKNEGSDNPQLTFSWGVPGYIHVSNPDGTRDRVHLPLNGATREQYRDYVKYKLKMARRSLEKARAVERDYKMLMPAWVFDPRFTVEQAREWVKNTLKTG